VERLRNALDIVRELAAEEILSAGVPDNAGLRQIVAEVRFALRPGGPLSEEGVPRTVNQTDEAGRLPHDPRSGDTAGWKPGGPDGSDVGAAVEANGSRSGTHASAGMRPQCSGADRCSVPPGGRASGAGAVNRENRR
jgi:hypothetical protein